MLPVRFGTVMADDEAVARAAARRRTPSACRRCWTSCAGRVQVTSRAPTPRTRCCAASSRLAGGRGAARAARAGCPRTAGYFERDPPRRAGRRRGRAPARGRTPRTCSRALEPLASPARAEAAAGTRRRVQPRVPGRARAARRVRRRGRRARRSKLGDRIAVRYVGPLAPYSFAEPSWHGERPDGPVHRAAHAAARARARHGLGRREAPGAGRARALRRVGDPGGAARAARRRARAARSTRPRSRRPRTRWSSG